MLNVLKIKFIILFFSYLQRHKSSRCCDWSVSEAMLLNLTSSNFTHSKIVNNATSAPSTNPIVLVVFFLVTCVSIGGNSLVLYSWYTKRIPRRETFFFVSNLAKSDLLLTSASLMFLMEGRAPSSVGNFLCKAGQFLGEVSSFTSILTLVAIGRRRYSKIASISFGHQFTADLQSTARRQCWVIWLTAAFISAPVLSTFKMVNSETSGTHCVDAQNWPAVYRRVYYVFRFVFFFCLPLVFLVFSYCYMYVALRKHVVQDAFSKPAQTKLLVAIVTTFVICVGPKIVFRTVEQFEVWTKNSAATILYVAGILLVTQPALNPIIYSVSSPELRKAFKALLRCRKIGIAEDANNPNGKNNMNS